MGEKKKTAKHFQSYTVSPGTLQHDGPQDQRVAVLGGPQSPGLAPDAAPAAAGVGVGRGADHHRALHVHRVVGPQELEGFERETDSARGAGADGLVGAVTSAPILSTQSWRFFTR